MEKYPAEIITVTFDFADIATAIASPVVSVRVEQGKEDATVGAMLSGSPEVEGLAVLQRVQGGLAGNTYRLTCEVDDEDGEHFVVVGTLSVLPA